MQSSLVVLTGASGAGKTTLARAILDSEPENCDVLFFDSIGVPSTEAMKAWGDGHQPGGAWLRAMTLHWFERFSKILEGGRSVLFEGQMRIAFIDEALRTSGLKGVRIILVDCDDETRTRRLCIDRAQPDLANEHMLNWARYLRNEALDAGHEILDTGKDSPAECVARLRSYLTIV